MGVVEDPASGDGVFLGVAGVCWVVSLADCVSSSIATSSLVSSEPSDDSRPRDAERWEALPFVCGEVPLTWPLVVPFNDELEAVELGAFGKDGRDVRSGELALLLVEYFWPEGDPDVAVPRTWATKVSKGCIMRE